MNTLVDHLYSLMFLNKHLFLTIDAYFDGRSDLVLTLKYDKEFLTQDDLSDFITDINGVVRRLYYQI